MGKRFLLALFTLSALLITLHARPDGYSKPDYVRAVIRARALLEDPKPENSIIEPPLAAEKDHDDGEERENEAEGPSTEPKKNGRHHSASAYGGKVIIGGLVTAIFAVVYCYIRVTRRRHADQK